MHAHLTVETRQGIATVTLRRPDAHNALDAELIRALSETFAGLAAAAEVRVVLLAAEGKSFCAGGDLAWMRAAGRLPPEENRADALRLAGMLRAVYECPKPVIARIQGPAYGGGVGLAAACDLVVAVESAFFCFSEARLGLAPAVIAPFVVRRLSPALARRYFLTSERIPAAEARRLGLIDETAASEEELDAWVRRWQERLLAAAPGALAACKRAVDAAASVPWDELLPAAARELAERRAGEEAQEGIAAFLEKRRPRWELAP